MSQGPLYPGAPIGPIAPLPFAPLVPAVPPEEDAAPDGGELFDVLAKDILPDRVARPDDAPEESLSPLARMADEAESTDVLGSYTGTASDGQAPVQDADDL